MKWIILFLFSPLIAHAQSPCEDFLALIGQRDINQTVIDFQKNCGPFEESISDDNTTKTWTSKEKGIEMTFINRAEDQFALPQFEVFTIELTSFTGKGGYEGAWPFGFQMGMDHKMVKDHTKGMEDVTYERGDLGKRRSYFTYTGPTNQAAQERQVKVYISQYDGRTITSMRLRLK